MPLEADDQTVFFGADGAVEFISKQLLRLGCRRVFCVTGRNSYSTSGAKRILDLVLKDQVGFRFSDFSTNPQFSDLTNGLECFRNFNPDCVIGMGGGSVLDMAKLINFFGSSKSDPNEWLDGTRTEPIHNSLPMIAIPTTAGSGSEGTAFAVVYRNRKKYSVAHSNMLPCVAVVNPSLTETMSPYQTACCGFDAFSQGIEAFWAVGSTERSRQYSAKAISFCMQHLEAAVLNPTVEHRMGMMRAAYLAGKAINIAKTTAAHALSYTLTSHYGFPHGHAVAMILPWVFKLNSAVQEMDLNDSRGVEFVDARMGELCAMLSCDSSDDASQFIHRLALRIGLDGERGGASWGDVSEIRSSMVECANMERMGNNPRKLVRNDLQWIASYIH